MTGAALRTERFSFAYPGTTRPALRDVTLEVAAGEVVGVVGAEGSGRTTLGMALSGFVPRFTGGETAGTLEVAGRDPRRSSPEELAGETAMVFEDPESQLTQIHVLDEVMAPLVNRGVDPGEAEQRAARLLERVGIDPALASRRLWQLPTGDKMRLAVAAALATEPRLLVLDTVAGSLDPSGRARLADLVRDLAPGTTVVTIENDLDLVAPLADRLLVMVGGTLVASGPPGEVLADAALVDRAGVAMPVSLRLAAELGLSDRPVSVDSFRTSLAESARPAGAGGSGHGRRRAEVRATTGERPQARLDDVSYAYSDGTQAVAGVSLALRTGEVHGLVGGNGAGKSTLLRMLAGLVHPDRGRVEVAGTDVAGCKVRDLVGTVGIVLPHPDRQLTEPTVAGEVGFTLRRWPGSRMGRLRRERDGRRDRSDRSDLDGGGRDGHRRGLGHRELDDVHEDDVAARVRGACQLVGLDDAVMSGDPRLLPRAPRRFVVLASALALDPPILVLDEPSADLDATWRARLRHVVRTVRDRGTAVLLAENDIDLVAEVADDVTLLEHGQVVLQGRLEEVLAEPNWRTLEQARTCPPRAALLGQVLGVPAFSYDHLVPAGVETDDA